MMEEVIFWFKENGGKIHDSVRFYRSREYGLAFRADKDLATDGKECICRCPLSLSLSILNCRPRPPADVRPVTDSVTAKLVEHDVKPDIVTAFLLAEERLKGRKSFWAPYINLLPKESDMSTPIWFNDDEMLWLLGTRLALVPDPMGTKSLRGIRKAALMQSWENAINILGPGDTSAAFTWELFLWAVTILSSRSFTSKALLENDENPFSMLYPVLDYFNHKFGAKVEWHANRGNFILQLAEPVLAGKQIFNNYCPKSNEELLFGYGFCIYGNPCDQVSIILGKPPATGHAKLRDKLPQHWKCHEWSIEEATFYLRGSKHFSGGYSTPLDSTGLRGVPRELLISMYILSESPTEYSYGNGGDKETEKAPNIRMSSAIKTLLDRIRHMERSIAYVDEHQLKLIEPMNDRERYAKIYRHSQRDILNEILDEIEAAKSNFSSSDNYADVAFSVVFSSHDATG